jgi:hypothetical protein
MVTMRGVIRRATPDDREAMVAVHVAAGAIAVRYRVGL